MSASSTTPHEVPGSVAGTVFQFERALAWLADGTLPPNAKVGIEADDDLGVRVDDEPKVREQDKHSIGRPPFTDGSEKLWQPLLNWLEAATNGTLDLDTTRLFLVTNQQLPDDCLALLFGPDMNPEAVQKCLDRIQAYAVAAKKDALKISLLVDKLLAYGEPVLRKLVAAVTCLDARHATASTELRQKIFNQLQMLADDPRDGILDELAGWYQRQVLDLIRAKQPAWITREEFLRQYRAIQQRLQRQRRRERSEALIPLTDEEKDAARGHTFVRQLDFINGDDDMQLDAIADFLRCNIERSRFAKEGDITETDWTSFDTNIHKFWKNNRRRTLNLGTPTTPLTEEQLGHKIYYDCQQYRENLAGEPTNEYYLTRGTFHRQADKSLLGWHPRYVELLKNTP